MEFLMAKNDRATRNHLVKLPPQVTAIYRAVRELEAMYPDRKFTPDGHLVGSIGEVIAAEALGLTLYKSSHPGHDAFDAKGDVQIKMTGGKSISLYATCARLVVLRIVSPETAEIVYDGSGEAVWRLCGKPGKNGQRVISLNRLRAIAGLTEHALSSPLGEASAENDEQEPDCDGDQTDRENAIENMRMFSKGRPISQGTTIRHLIEADRRY
jgi:hypothetical protein